MKTIRLLTILAACVTALSCGCDKTPAAEEVVELQMPGNPFITELYLADPSAHVWDDGRLYVYPSHDVAPPRGCDLMDGYHVFSTTDMVNWTDHGEFLHSRDVEWGRPDGGFMWAPDAAYRNGKYYYYFPHPSGTDWNNTWKVGVGVSDKPTMENLKLLGYLEGLGDAFSMIDPCVFTDDDDRREAQGQHDRDRRRARAHEGDEGLPRRSVGVQEQRQVLPDVCRQPPGTRPRGTEPAPLLLERLRSICVDKLYFNEDGTIREVVQTFAK